MLALRGFRAFVFCSEFRVLRVRGLKVGCRVVWRSEELVIASPCSPMITMLQCRHQKEKI